MLLSDLNLNKLLFIQFPGSESTLDRFLHNYVPLIAIFPICSTNGIDVQSKNTGGGNA